MNIIVEREPDCRAIVRVEFPGEAVSAERKRITAYFSQQARIPGFRPGKAPAKVIEKRYKNDIDSKLKEMLIDRGLEEAVKKEKLNVIRITGLEDDEFHLDESFTFTAKVQTAPEFTLPEYKNIPVEVMKIEVTEHDIDHDMDHLRQRMANFEDVEGRSLEMDDYAVLSFEATLDGQPLGEVVEQAAYMSKAEDQWLRISEESFLPGFCADLVGMSIGDKKDVEVTFDEEFGIEELREKTAIFAVELKGIKTQVIPEWTDELAESMEEGMTVEKLREGTREIIKDRQERERVNEMNTQILEYLDEELEFELPPQVVQEETQRQVDQIVSRSQMQGMTEEDLEENKDSIVEHASTQAEVSVKTGFIIQQIAEKEEIKATEDEIAMYVAQLAQSNQISPKKYLKQLEKERAFGPIINRIESSKTLEFLREHANVTEIDRPPHDCGHDHGHQHDDEDHDHEHDHDHEDEENPSGEKEE